MKVFLMSFKQQNDLLSSPSPNPLGQSQTQSNPNKVLRGLGLTLKSYGPPPNPTTQPITFRGPECAYMVQIDALSTPECQEGVPSHSRWTARGRTWGSSRRTL